MDEYNHRQEAHEDQRQQRQEVRERQLWEGIFATAPPGRSSILNPQDAPSTTSSAPAPHDTAAMDQRIALESSHDDARGTFADFFVAAISYLLLQDEPAH